MIKDNGKKPKGVKIEEECGKGLGLYEQMRNNPVEKSTNSFNLDMLEQFVKDISTNRIPKSTGMEMYVDTPFLEGIDDDMFMKYCEGNITFIVSEETLDYVKSRYERLTKTKPNE